MSTVLTYLLRCANKPIVLNINIKLERFIRVQFLKYEKHSGPCNE